jgi:hypothetical protein
MMNETYRLRILGTEHTSASPSPNTSRAYGPPVLVHSKSVSAPWFVALIGAARARRRLIKPSPSKGERYLTKSAELRCTACAQPAEPAAVV